MPSTFTDSLRFEEQGIGENNNTWGDKLNSTIDLIDKSIAGHVSVATTGGTTQLTTVNNAEDQARYRIIEVTGTLASNAVIEVPEVSKEYIVWDSTTRGGFTITFRLGAAGGTVLVPASTTRAFGINTDGSTWRPLSADLASETAPGIVEIATTAEAQAGSSNSVVLTPVRLQDVTATAARKGVVELATNAEAQTGTDTSRALTPANLQAVTATETRRGVVELATNAEAQTGTDTTRALTAANLQAVTATETRKGVIELATSTETTTGTDTTRGITPATLKAGIDARLGTTGNLGYQETTLELDGTFDAGQFLKVSRIGAQVVVTALSVLSHDFQSGAVSLAGLVPSWARPATPMFASFFISATAFGVVRINADGTYALNYETFSGGSPSRDNTGTPPLISYNV